MRREQFQSIVMVASMCVAGIVLIISYITSFANIQALGVLTKAVPKGLEWTLPVVIDGMTLTGIMLILARAQDRARATFPWVLVGVGTGASVGANVAHLGAGAPLLSQIIAAFFPVALAALAEALREEHKRRIPGDVPHHAVPRVPRAVAVVERADPPDEIVVTEHKSVTRTTRSGGIAAQVRELTARGLSQAEIIAETGAKPETVRRTLRRLTSDKK